MSQKQLGLLLLVVGLVAGLASALADVIGVGGFPRIGTQQALGIGAGALVAVAGLVVLMRSGRD